MSSSHSAGCSARAYLVYLLATLLFIFTRPAFANSCDQPVATLVHQQGQVEYSASNSGNWQAVESDQTFCASERIRVGDNSRASLLLHNETLVQLNENSTLNLSGMRPADPAWVELIQGFAHFISRVKQKFEVRTPFVNAAVEGTEFSVGSQDNAAIISVFEGKVRVSNNQGSVLLTSGQSIRVIAGEAPVLEVKLKPEDSVQWALYYQPIFGEQALLKAAAGANSSDGQRIKQALQHYHQGRFTDAIETLEGADYNTLPRLHLFRAALYLGVGQLDEADADLRTATEIGSLLADSNAMRAMIQLMMNRSSEALETAKAAHRARSDSVSAKLALSHVWQAHFELDKALKVVIQNTPLLNSNALLLARAAELELAHGNHQRALVYAQQAIKLKQYAPNAQNVLGYAQLSHHDPSTALAYFDQTLAIDPANPYAHLGKGLALLRQNQLEQGRRQIEIAALMHPQISLIRSYLGKAYHEEKRYKEAEKQYTLAKELDPKDPTPWFYHALSLHAQRLSAAALHAYERAIDLNDNRAVYRSRLMLDKDLAAQAVNTGQIYSEMGLTDYSESVAAEAIVNDYGSAPAHIQIANSYAQQPRHSMATSSELLVARLLLPVSSYPVPVGFAQNRPGTPRYTSDPVLRSSDQLSSRDNIKGNLNTYFGRSESGDINGLEGTLGAYSRKQSLALGQYLYQDAGWEENTAIKTNTTQLQYKYEILPGSTLSLAKTVSETEQGDRYVRYLDIVSEGIQNTLSHDLSEISLTIRPSSQKTLLINFTDFRRTLGYQSHTEVFPVTLDIVDDAVIEGQALEGLFINRFKRTSLLLGLSAQSFTDSRTTEETTEFFPFPAATVITENTDYARTISMFSYLSYSHRGSSIHTGISADHARNGSLNMSQFSPKLAFQQRFGAISLHGGYTRTLNKHFTTYQTLEPATIQQTSQYIRDREYADISTVSYGVDLRRGPARLYLDGTMQDISEPVRNVDNDFIFYGITENTIKSGLDVSFSPLQMNLDIERTFIENNEDYLINSILSTRDLIAHLGLRASPGKHFRLRIDAWGIDQNATLIDTLTPDTPISADPRIYLMDLQFKIGLTNNNNFAYLKVHNVGDNHFRYQDSTPTFPRFIPERVIMFGLNINN